ncbi:39502_t:CDS:2 [Gigaspora margarita]|uniref:39502_t:CDS:1 n=1 Tax=Gigaspora margarita TaxID=4874 RepID=A0ABM8VWE5_GIGMA|nr:39502_t:CDS:2 [Gigaspora margarita]
MVDSLQKLREKRDKLKKILADIKTTGDNFNKIDSDLETVEKALDTTIGHFNPGGSAAMDAKDEEISKLNAEIKKCKQKVLANLTSGSIVNKGLYELLESLEVEIKDIKKQKSELETKIGDLDKEIDDISNDIDKVGEETEKVKNKSEATKNKVGDLAIKGFAVLGVFAGGY